MKAVVYVGNCTCKSDKVVGYGRLIIDRYSIYKGEKGNGILNRMVGRAEAYVAVGLSSGVTWAVELMVLG